MASPVSSKSRAGVSAPEKGAFPIDHFKECSDIISSYLTCVSKHELMPKRCQKLQVEYLNCRMENGLMKKEPLDKLGFTKQNSYQTELEQKKELYMMYAKLQDEAMNEVKYWIDKKNNETSENPSNK